MKKNKNRSNIFLPFHKKMPIPFLCPADEGKTFLFEQAEVQCIRVLMN